MSGVEDILKLQEPEEVKKEDIKDSEIKKFRAKISKMSNKELNKIFGETDEVTKLEEIQKEIIKRQQKKGLLILGGVGAAVIGTPFVLGLLGGAGIGAGITYSAVTNSQRHQTKNKIVDNNI